MLFDAWFYRQHFIDLRKRVKNWKAPFVTEVFQAEREKAGGAGELTDLPGGNTALHWISFLAQIHEQLHCIEPARFQGWGQRGRDEPLEDRDLLLSMAAFTGVKIGEYYKELGDACRSDYLWRLRPKTRAGLRARPYIDRAVLWRRAVLRGLPGAGVDAAYGACCHASEMGL